MKGILFIFLLTVYVIVTGVTADMFAKKNVTPTATSFMMVFFPVIHLYTFIKYVIIKGKFGSFKQVDDELSKDE